MFGESHVLRAGTISTLSERIAFGYAERYNDDNGNKLSADELVSISKRLAGVKRSDDFHPGKFFIVPATADITDFSPAHNIRGEIATHFSSFDLSGNLLKIDILAHELPSLLKELQDSTGVVPTAIRLMISECRGCSNLATNYSSVLALYVPPINAQKVLTMKKAILVDKPSIANFSCRTLYGSYPCQYSSILSY